jgi:hypothetical protein
MVTIFIFLGKFCLGTAFGERGLKETFSKYGTTSRRLPFGQSNAYVGLDLRMRQEML